MNNYYASLFFGLGAFVTLCGFQVATANDDQKPRTELQKQVFAKIEDARKGKRPSVSEGKLCEGSLKNPAKLAAPEGVGYYLAHPTRGTNFGNDRLVFGLMELGVHMREKLGDHPDHRLRIHDLSSEHGGKQERHINHQMGLDVDLAFYATDPKGNLVSSVWTSYGADGKSKEGDRRFDAARNWEVVAGIVENRYFGEIRAILISDPLKEKMLAHANKQLKSTSDRQKRAALAVIIEKAEKLLRQPKSSPHDNHFHLSLSLKPPAPRAHPPAQAESNFLPQSRRCDRQLCRRRGRSYSPPHCPSGEHQRLW